VNMPFGKHRGTPLEELPGGYLAWLATLDNLRDPLRDAVDAERRRRGQGAQLSLSPVTSPPEPPAVAERQNADVPF
jgi:hypothetical protein